MNSRGFGGNCKHFAIVQKSGKNKYIKGAEKIVKQIFGKPNFFLL